MDTLTSSKQMMKETLRLRHYAYLMQFTFKMFLVQEYVLFVEKLTFNVKLLKQVSVSFSLFDSCTVSSVSRCVPARFPENRLLFTSKEWCRRRPECSGVTSLTILVFCCFSWKGVMLVLSDHIRGEKLDTDVCDKINNYN